MHLFIHMSMRVPIRLSTRMSSCMSIRRLIIPHGHMNSYTRCIHDRTHVCTHVYTHVAGVSDVRETLHFEHLEAWNKGGSAIGTRYMRVDMCVDMCIDLCVDVCGEIKLAQTCV